MRRFVVIGRNATASDDFRLDDLPGSSGRLDVLLRCLRAALLVSHGLRRDVVVYLVLLGGVQAPRVLRFDGAAAKYLRPDERSLATLVGKSLAAHGGRCRAGAFVEVRPGVALAAHDLSCVLADLGAATLYLLDESGADVRDAPEIARGDAAFFVGDHLGFDDATRASLLALGARALSVGPLSLHAEDAVAIVSNEIDRFAAARPMAEGVPRS